MARWPASARSTRRSRPGFRRGKFMFTYWPMTGQECIPATISQLTTSRDYMVTTYRGIHDQVAKGVDLYGHVRRGARPRGRGQQGQGRLARTFPIPPRARWSPPPSSAPARRSPMASPSRRKERGEDRVTIVNFGDGATSIGAVHEAMNLAGAWKLPVIFMCQNNTGANTRPRIRLHRQPDFRRPRRSARLQGRDARRQRSGRILQRHEGRDRLASAPARARSSSRRRPIRLGPHAGVGDNYNVTKEELAAAKERPPVDTTRALLIEAGICTEEELAGDRSRRHGRSRRRHRQGHGKPGHAGRGNADRRLRRCRLRAHAAAIIRSAPKRRCPPAKPRRCRWSRRSATRSTSP